MTSGIRSNWIQAIQKCMEVNQQDKVAPPAPTRKSSFNSKLLGKDSLDSRRIRDQGNRNKYLSSSPNTSTKSGANDINHKDSRQLGCTWPYKQKASKIAESISPNEKAEKTPTKDLRTKTSLPGFAGHSELSSSRYQAIPLESRMPRPTAPPSSFVVHSQDHQTINRRSRTSSPITTSQVHLQSSAKQSSPKPSRAPSAKVKSRSRTKSNRAKSPPPSYSFLDSPIKLDSSETPSIITPSKGITVSGKDAVVDLLETEVETLKSQLDEANAQIANMHKETSNLKYQLRSDKLEHRDSVDDLEKDQQRFFLQIEDMQADMDHAANVLSTKLKLSETETQTVNVELEKLKVKSGDDQKLIRKQQRQIEDLQAKLAESMSDLTAAENSLEDAHQTLSDHQRGSPDQDALKESVMQLENKLKLVETELCHAREELDLRESQVTEAKAETQVKIAEVEKLSKDVADSLSLKEEVESKTKELEDISVQLNSLNSQICTKEEQISMLSKQLEVSKDMKDSDLVKSKQELERKLESLQKQSIVTDSLNSDMADIMRSKDETIARLEEQVMEQESRVHELRNDLKLEMEESSNIQQTLDTTYSANIQLESALEQAKLEIDSKISEVNSMKELVEELREVNEENEAEKIHLNVLLDRTETKNSELVFERDNLSDVIIELKAQVESFQKKMSDKKDLENKLKHQIEQNHALSEKNATISAELQESCLRETELEEHIAASRVIFESDMEDKTQLINSLKEKVEALDKQLEENKTEKAVVSGQTVGNSSSDDDMYQQKIELLHQEIALLNTKLKDSEKMSDDLELLHSSLKQQVISGKQDHEAETDLLTSRVQDLTNKLSEAQKKTRKLERKLTRHQSKSQNGGNTNQKLSNEDNISNSSALEEDQPCTSSLSKDNTSDEVVPHDDNDVCDYIFELNNIVTDLNQFDLSAEQVELLTKIEDKLHNLKIEAADDSLSSTEDVSIQSKKTSLTDIDKLYLFADKLSLEAIIVGEMSYLIKSSADHYSEEQKHHLAQIEQASQQIKSLNSKIQRLQSGDNNQVVDIDDKYSSDSMIIHGRVKFLLDKYSRLGYADSLETNDMVKPHDNVRNILSKHHTYVTSQLKRDVESQTSQEILESHEQFVQTELLDVHRKVDYDQSVLESVSESLEALCCKDFASMILHKEEESNHAGKELEQFMKALESSLQKSVKSASKQSKMTLEFNIEDIQNRLSHFLSSTKGNIEKEITELSKALTSGDLLIEDIPKIDDITLKHKAAAFVNVAVEKYILIQRVSLLPSDYVANEHTKLSRSDSGINMPMTPAVAMLPKHSISHDMSELASTLQQDAESRKALGRSIESVIDVQSDDNLNPERVVDLISKATSMSSLDLNAFSNKCSVSDFVRELLTQVIHQAELVFLSHNKDLQRRQALVKLYKDMMAQSAADAAMQEDQLTELEQEVERLSSLLVESEHVQKEAQVNHSQVEKLRGELNKREEEFQRELESTVSRYQLQLESLRSELQDTETDYDSRQEQKDSMIQECEKRISDLEKELHVAKEGLQKAEREKDNSASKIKLQVADLEEDVITAKDEVERLQKEKADLESRMSNQVSGMEDEMEDLRAQHNEQVRAAKEEMRVLMKELGDQETKALEAEIQKMRSRLEDERTRHATELEKLRNEQFNEGASEQIDLSAKVHDLESQLLNMQADYEQELAVQKAAHRRELARSKDELLRLLDLAESQTIQLDDKTIKKKYEKEIQRVKDIYERGFATMERSHQKSMIEMRQTHKRDLDLLRHEKEQLLAEETQATQAALDAMRRSHQEEVQKERSKFLDLIAKTYSLSDVESLQKQHEDDLEMIQSEIKQLSEQYSIKCLENAANEQRLERQTKILSETRRRLSSLDTSHEELKVLMNHEVERLNKMLKVSSTGQSSERKLDETEEAYNNRVALRVKTLEVTQLEGVVSGLEDQLSFISKELNGVKEERTTVQNDLQSSHFKYEREISNLKQRLERALKGLNSDSSDNVQSVESNSNMDDSTVDETFETSSLSPLDVRSPGRKTSSNLMKKGLSQTPSTRKSQWRQRFASCPTLKLEGIEKDPEACQDSQVHPSSR